MNTAPPSFPFKSSKAADQSASKTAIIMPLIIATMLSAALKAHFDVEFTAPKEGFPDKFALAGDQIFKFNTEKCNIRYGDQIWEKDGVIHEIDRGRGDAMFDRFVFDNKTKKLQKLDENEVDSFARDFNQTYGGNPGLKVDKNGNLTLNGETLICAEGSRITTLYLPGLRRLSPYSLCDAKFLRRLYAPDLRIMGDSCLQETNLITLEATQLTEMGYHALHVANSLTSCYMPQLEIMKGSNLSQAPELTLLDAQKLKSMNATCLHYVPALTAVNTPQLETIGYECFHTAPSLKTLNAPRLIATGSECFQRMENIEYFKVAPQIQYGRDNFKGSRSLKLIFQLYAPQWAQDTARSWGALPRTPSYA
jgi:hypothetical protein